MPRNDPTLMFTNAGMVQFKNVFTGAEKRALPARRHRRRNACAPAASTTISRTSATPRATTPSSRCSGNFSFGDYFKERAIELAWNLITKEFGLPKDRLLVTVFHDGRRRGRAVEEDRRPAGRAHHPHPDLGQFLGDGRHRPLRPVLGDLLRPRRADPGRPAGHARRRTATASSRSGISSSCSSSRWPRRRASPLPKPSIDTGMGLERIAAVLQGKHDNYDIDLMRALIVASAEATGRRARRPAQRCRTASSPTICALDRFLIADGVLPSNEGRGYVLRRIMRRAMRHAHMMGAREPLMYRLVPALVARDGPGLSRARARRSR